MGGEADETGASESAETQGQGGEQKQQDPQQKPGQQASGGNGEGFWRRKAEQAERKLKDIERASMTEAEKAKVEREDAIRERDLAVKERDEIRLRTQFEKEAAKAGVVDPDLAFLAADRSLLRFEDGKVVGLKQTLEKLQKERPILFQQPRRAAASGGGNPPGGFTSGSPSQKINDWIRSHIR